MEVEDTDELNNAKPMNSAGTSIYNPCPYVTDQMYYFRTRRETVGDILQKKMFYLNMAIRRLIKRTLATVMYAIRRKKTI